MAWTTPMTAVAGAIYTAAQFNTYTRDNLLALRASPDHRCNAYHNTTQAVTAGNTNSLNLNSETLDTASMHDVSTNNNRITIQTGGGGVYWCFGSTHVVSAGTTLSARLHLAINGAAQHTRNLTGPASQILELTSLEVFWMQTLAPTDYVELQGQAISQDVTFGSATAAMATRLIVIGPLPPS